MSVLRLFHLIIDRILVVVLLPLVFDIDDGRGRFRLQREGQRDTDVYAEIDEEDEPEGTGELLEEISGNDDIAAEGQMPRLVEEKKIKKKRVQRQERMLVRRNSVTCRQRHASRKIRFGKYLLKYPGYNSKHTS